MLKIPQDQFNLEVVKMLRHIAEEIISLNVKSHNDGGATYIKASIVKLRREIDAMGEYFEK